MVISKNKSNNNSKVRHSIKKVLLDQGRKVQNEISANFNKKKHVAKQYKLNTAVTQKKKSLARSLTKTKSKKQLTKAQKATLRFKLYYAYKYPKFVARRIEVKPYIDFNSPSTDERLLYFMLYKYRFKRRITFGMFTKFKLKR
jgi:hypothetical protein